MNTRGIPSTAWQVLALLWFAVLSWRGYPSSELAREGSTPVLPWAMEVSPSWPGRRFPHTEGPPVRTRVPPAGTGVPLWKAPGTSNLRKDLELGYPLERTCDQWSGKELGPAVTPPLQERTCDQWPGKEPGTEYPLGKQIMQIILSAGWMNSLTSLSTWNLIKLCAIWKQI